MTRVLVPIEILEGESVSPGLMHLLGTVDVTVLGFHVLPEQTPPDQARHQFGARATDALEDIEEEFRSAGGEADHRLVFTHDAEKSIGRIADEVNARAFAISGVTGDVDRVLVSLSGDVATDRIVAFVRELLGKRNIAVTFIHASRDEQIDTLRGESAAEQLREDGINVQVKFAENVSPRKALIEELPGHDVIIMGENAPSLRSLFFGDESERVAAESVGPVLVVRYVEALDTIE